MTWNNIEVIITKLQIHSLDIYEQTFDQVRGLELYLVLLEDKLDV